VWLVSGYAHVIVLLFVVIVTLASVTQKSAAADATVVTHYMSSLIRPKIYLQHF